VSVPTGFGNYPPGVTDNDPHFGSYEEDYDDDPDEAYMEECERQSQAPVVPKPYERWKHPPGCPDGDWCRGNGVCYWDCQADGSYWDCQADTGTEP
jgi:hypothetical protein